MYGRCRFAERCSFLHFYGHDQTENERFQAIMKNVAKLRQEIDTHRKESTKLRPKVKAQFEEHKSLFTNQNENNCRILDIDIIKDIKEEVDVCTVVKGSNSYRVVISETLGKGSVSTAFAQSRLVSVLTSSILGLKVSRS